MALLRCVSGPETFWAFWVRAITAENTGWTSESLLRIDFIGYVYRVGALHSVAIRSRTINAAVGMATRQSVT